MRIYIPALNLNLTGWRAPQTPRRELPTLTGGLRPPDPPFESSHNLTLALKKVSGTLIETTLFIYPTYLNLKILAVAGGLGRCGRLFSNTDKDYK